MVYKYRRYARMDITDHLRELIDDISDYHGVIGSYSDLVNNKPTLLHNMYVINVDYYLKIFHRDFNELTNFLWI